MNAQFFRKKIANIILSIVILCVAVLGISGTAIPVTGSTKPIYNVPSSSNVCLMVNVYWGEEFLPEMLDIFAQNQVKTTFFVGGCWVEKNEELLKKIYSDGHEIANHGYFHKDHKKISYERNIEEISSTHNLIKSILGIEMNLFSPPSASFSNVTLEVAENLGYTTIIYSKDTIDWRDKDSDLILSRATKNVAGGDLILMHPTSATVSTLQLIIDKIKEKGLCLTTVSGVISAGNEV